MAADHWRGDHAQVDHVDAGVTQAFAQGAGQFRAGQAAIAADHDPALSLGQRGGAEGTTDVTRDAGVQGLVDDAANIVSLENRFGESDHFVSWNIGGLISNHYCNGKRGWRGNGTRACKPGRMPNEKNKGRIREGSGNSDGRQCAPDSMAPRHQRRRWGSARRMLRVAERCRLLRRAGRRSTCRHRPIP